jgi:hypothetical protein
MDMDIVEFSGDNFEPSFSSLLYSLGLGRVKSMQTAVSDAFCVSSVFVDGGNCQMELFYSHLHLGACNFHRHSDCTFEFELLHLTLILVKV